MFYNLKTTFFRRDAMNKSHYMYFMALMTGIVLTTSDMSTLSAQESNSEEFTLEEITVTAQKRAENQQKVPISMEIISGDDIRDLAKTDIDEILSNLSNAYINRTSGSLRVSLRGVSNDMPGTDDLSPSQPTISVNTDGIYSTRKSTGQGLYDVERVEVLFGPQSTLYASNSPGGIVNIITSNPKTDTYEASGTLEYGNYNLLHTEGSMNVPINDTMALRAAFSTSIRDGYLSNGSDDEDFKSARLRALYQPTENLSFVITGEISRSGGKGLSGVTAFEDQDDVDDPWSTTQAVGADRNRKQKKLYGNMDWNFGFATATLVPSYSVGDYVSSSTQVQPATGITVMWDRSMSDTEKGVELRLASSSESSVKWLLGLNYYNAYGDSSQAADTGASRNTINESDTRAIFGNITYPIADRFRVTGGARKSRAISEMQNDEIRINARTGAATPVSEVVKKEHDTPDYKVGIEYDMGPNSMLYADWSSSFRILPMAKNRDTPAEQLKAYTIGSKNRFFENKLQLNASGYFYNYDDFHAMHGQIIAPDTGLPDEGAQTAGDAIMYGADIQTSAIITKHDTLNVSISYMKTEFKSLIFDWVSEYLEDEDWSGKEMTFSPHWSISTNYKHIFELPNGGTVSARIDANYRTPYIISIVEEIRGVDYTGLRYQEAHVMSNFSAGYTSPDGKWTLTGYVKNLTNYAEKRSLIDQTMSLSPPRTFGAILSITSR